MFLSAILTALFYLSNTVTTQNSYFIRRIMIPETVSDETPEVEVNVFEVTPSGRPRDGPVMREENHRIEHHEPNVARILNMLNIRDGEESVRRPGPNIRPLSFRSFGGERWPNAVIPFIIDFPLRRIERTIHNAMREIESKSCIRFKRRENENDFVFLRMGGGCFSGVGRKGGRQVVSLGRGCENYGIVLHELMHVIGFYHLHQRHDRDRFLSIHWDNINPLYMNNFKLLSPDVMPIDDTFDYQSIMMYGSTSFSRDRFSVTMTPRLQGVMIQDPSHKSSLSPIDVRTINRMYDCNSHEGNFLDE